MVLTPSGYLNWFWSYYFLKIDKSTFFTNMNHDERISQYITGVPISRIPLGYTVVTPGYLGFSGVRKHLMVIT